MADEYDVFLSYSSADKPAVEAIALRVRDEAAACRASRKLVGSGRARHATKTAATPKASGSARAASGSGTVRVDTTGVSVRLPAVCRELMLCSV